MLFGLFFFLLLLEEFGLLVNFVFVGLGLGPKKTVCAWAVLWDLQMWDPFIQDYHAYNNLCLFMKVSSSLLEKLQI